MVKETRISVPNEDVEWISTRLAKAGLTVLDTGERVTTEDGVGAETVLAVSSFEEATEVKDPIEGSLLRP